MVRYMYIYFFQIEHFVSVIWINGNVCNNFILPHFSFGGVGKSISRSEAQAKAKALASKVARSLVESARRSPSPSQGK